MRAERPGGAGRRSGRRQGRSRRDAGFTLMEMLVVLVVLGLALGLVLARGAPRSPALDLRAGAQDLAEGLRLARARAIFRGRPEALTLDLAQHRFQVGDAAVQALPAGIAMAVLTASGESGRALLARFVFAPDGSASGGRIEMAEGGHRARITIDWLTGRVSLSDGS